MVGGLGIALSLELFSLLTFLQPAEWLFWRRWALLAEAFLPLSWLTFALTFSRDRGLRGLAPFPLFLLIAAPLLPLATLLSPLEEFFLQPDSMGNGVLILTRLGFFFSLTLVVYLTYALMQLERTLVSLPRHARWQVKFEIIGAGTLLTMYLVYFSQGLLNRSLEMNLLPAHSLSLTAAIALMAFSRFHRGEAARIQVSREFAFRSLVALAVGGYLFGLGLLGEGLRFLHPELQRTLLTVAGLSGGVGIIAVFLSEGMRRKIKVSLHKNFYQDKYDYRDQWLCFTRRIGTARNQQELHQTILIVIGETFAVQDTILYLRDPDGDVFRAVAAHGTALPTETFALGNTLVRYLAGGKWIFSSRDENPQIWQENHLFLETGGISFIVPLHFDRSLEGFILLGRLVNRREDYTYEDFDLMKLLAAQAAATILSLRLADQLAGSREMAAIGKVSAFVLHDLKNLVSSLALVVENARDCLDDEDFRADMLLTLSDNVVRMRHLIGRLQDLEEKPTLDLQPGDLATVVREGARLAGDRGIEVTGGPVPAHFDPEEMRKVALNLLLNAREAGNGHPVQVEVGGNERVYFRVRDKGSGMSEEFMRRCLFQPFETTKSKGFGIGLYQCKHIVEAHGGTIEVNSTPGHGSEFTVWLPAGLTTDTAHRLATVDGNPPA